MLHIEPRAPFAYLICRRERITVLKTLYHGFSKNKAWVGTLSKSDPNNLTWANNLPHSARFLKIFRRIRINVRRPVRKLLFALFGGDSTTFGQVVASPMAPLVVDLDDDPIIAHEAP